jgi:hypothetical protein
VQARYLGHFANSVKWLDKALRWDFTVGIKVDRLYMLKSLEDFGVTLDRIAMANQWKTEQKG